MWPAVPNQQIIIANRFRLGRSLGEGGFGEVFQAEDIKFDPHRLVAIKLVHPQFLFDQKIRDDIKREASVLAQFTHPNILRVIDFDVTRDSAYIVTELAEGGSLARKLRPDPLAEPVPLKANQVRQYLEQLAQGLDEAHTHNLIHRDIKPANILLDKSGRPLLADFGLSMSLGTSSSKLVNAEAFGTPEYAAPEIWEDQAGQASDIYALGILLYQMISGYTPYQGTNVTLMQQHLHHPIPRLKDKIPSLIYPLSLDNVIAKALAKNPTDRYKTAGDLYADFLTAINKPTTTVGTNITKSNNVNTFEIQFKLACTTKNLAKIIELGEQILTTQPNATYVFKELSKAYSTKGTIQNVQADYEQASLSLSRASQLDPFNPDYYYERGKIYFKAARLAEAVQDFSHALSLISNVKYWYWRGRAYYEQANYSLALADFNQTLALDNSQIDYFFWRGKANFNQAFYEPALQDFIQSLQRDPENHQYCYWIGTVFFKLADYQKAVGFFEQAIRIEAYFAKSARTNDEYWFWAGRSYLNLKDLPKALTSLNEAIKLNDKQAEYWFWRGIALYKDAKYLQALAYLNQAITLEPNKTDYYHWRSSCYLKMRSYREMIVDLKFLCRVDPSNPDYYYGCGLGFFELGNYEMAILELNRAIELNPPDYGNYLLRGKCYYHVSYWKAVNDFNTGIGLEPNAAELYWWRSQTYLALKDNKAAKADLQKASELGHHAATDQLKKLKWRF